MPTPTPEELDRITQTVVAKATRILGLVEAPLGVWGEVAELGVAQTRPDYQSLELLYGLRYRGYNLEGVTVTAEMVIRQGLQTDPDDFPDDRLPDVERAIAAASSWTVEALAGIGAA